MRVLALCVIVGTFCGLTRGVASAQQSNQLTLVPIQSVKLEDSFWSPKRKVWQEVTIPDCFTKFENDRGGAFNNFDRVRDGKSDQVTEYPWNGDVKITVEPAKTAEFDLHIRIPGWCQGPPAPDELYQAPNRPLNGAAHLKVNGKAIENPDIVRGYATVHRRWSSGDVVQLTLDMPVQRLKASTHVDADKGRAVLMRGPLVYCFEGADNGGGVKNLVIPEGTEFTPEYRSNLLGGVTVLHATATAVFQTPASAVVSMPFKVTAIPYYANANRGTCQMQVWMPEAQEGCSPQKQD